MISGSCFFGNALGDQPPPAAPAPPSGLDDLIPVSGLLDGVPESGFEEGVPPSPLAALATALRAELMEPIDVLPPSGFDDGAPLSGLFDGMPESGFRGVVPSSPAGATSTTPGKGFGSSARALDVKSTVPIAIVASRKLVVMISIPLGLAIFCQRRMQRFTGLCQNEAKLRPLVVIFRIVGRRNVIAGYHPSSQAHMESQ